MKNAMCKCESFLLAISQLSLSSLSALSQLRGYFISQLEPKILLVILYNAWYKITKINPFSFSCADTR